MYVMGITPASVRTSAQGPEFKLGTLGAVVNQSTLYTAPMSDTGSTAGADVGPKVFMYVKSTAGVTGAGYVVSVNPATNDATMLTTTTAAAGAGGSQGYPVGVAQAAIAAGGYGWVQVYGTCQIQCAGDVAISTTLNTTATPGSMDDAATVAIKGMTLTAAKTGAGLGNGFVNWPTA